MNGTPRLRSSYPSTPESQKRTASKIPSSGGEGSRIPLQAISRSARAPTTTSQPLIPLTVLDAPSQRLYVCALYIALLAWRLYDWSNLVEDEAESFWLFIKWVALDGIVLYGLPELRIPWLEWSSTATTGIFLVHAIVNGMLMFRVPIPIEAGLAVVARHLYDRELSVSENRVKPASILHNSSLIMGKQIINILPEGSVTLNPDGYPFCIENKNSIVKLPIRLNQTDPVYIELLRLDFDTSTNESIVINHKELQSLKKQAEKRRPKDSDTLTLDYSVRKPGLYRLQTVMEKSNLEVQRRMSDTLVVLCPKAVIQPSLANKCIGDLSDLTIQVTGTPPLKIVYSRRINEMDESFHFQSLQPEDLVSPLLGATRASTFAASYEEDMSWGGLHSIDVRLNESMASSGRWLYSIDEIHDATGNIANFSARAEESETIHTKGTHLEHAFTVHERPVAQLDLGAYGSQLRVASGRSAEFPIKLSSSSGSSEEYGHAIAYRFSPIDTLAANGDHGSESIVVEFTTKSSRQRPTIHKPGLYTLLSISSQHCEGEIREPSSVLLMNPPKPDLAISSEDIHDKCADNSIGIMVDMDLSGTPPFVVRYEVEQSKTVERHQIEVDGSRHQLELKPREAGHFTYRFTSIDDAVYKDHSLTSSELTLQQDVKPPASAYFVSFDQVVACIDEPVQSKVLLSGEPPFTLEYELAYGGKRKKQKVSDINAFQYTITTDPLTRGGDYSLALVSAQDKTGCKIFLSDEIRINVRRQRPKASWAHIESRRSVMTLEDKIVDLPLRLEGEAPWTITYRNLNDTSKIEKVVKQRSNDHIQINGRGIYKIESVHDRQCPGTVDETASSFEVNWLARPQLRISDSSGIQQQGNKYVKREVCEGDVDAMEIKLSGSPPYHLKYQHHHKPDRGSQSVNVKEIDAALGSVTIPMDTSKAGSQTYGFSELSDNAYDHDPKKHTALTVQQIVNPKPSATFVKPGQSYKYCKEEESGDEVIPIELHGLPPFYLEIDIKHQSSSRPETVKLANIDGNHYDFRIPHRVLSLGAHHLSVRKVRDSRGCQTKLEYGAPKVQVQVFDVPTIYALEPKVDYCVGDRISYTLSGTPPFDIYYNFGDVQRKAKSSSTNFRRIAEKPGNFTITSISDRASECKAKIGITKTIHEMPSVKISKGRQVSVDIHEGGQAQILFEFWGTPPFEFTYTRSTNARKGHKSQVLETKHDISFEHSKTVQASQEGTYEVVAIKDKFCAFSTQRLDGKAEKLLH
ncbi:hypothetical protein O988_01482 [Pseudogymnoascus sp. VKM F-3808]|nr:hypothetical protein O988_01482 [Pseudogymnoascus sp. VKM F-3808]